MIAEIIYLLLPILGIIGIAVFIPKLASNKKNFKTDKCDDPAEKSRRAADRGQLVSMSLMFMAGIQMLLKSQNPSEKILLVAFGFIYAAVIGYMGDQMIGGDDGFSFESKAWQIRYGLGSLTTGSFFRYLITVFLDMFVSGCLIDVFQIVADPLTQRVKKMKLPFGSGYRDVLTNNFDNILQSVVAFATFMAYTNDTRFNWAYPPNTASKEDIIPVPTIKLITTVAGIVYLIANIPGNAGTSSLQSGSPMGDSLGTKLVYVCATLGLLTMGSMGIGFNLDPIKDREELDKQVNAALPKELEGETKWYLADKKWAYGLAFLTVINFIGIGMPLMTSSKLGKLKYPISIIASLILPGLLGSIAMSADQKYFEKAKKAGVQKCK
jgi:hypothetical protein